MKSWTAAESRQLYPTEFQDHLSPSLLFNISSGLRSMTFVLITAERPLHYNFAITLPFCGEYFIEVVNTIILGEVCSFFWNLTNQHLFPSSRRNNALGRNFLCIQNFTALPTASLRRRCSWMSPLLTRMQPNSIHWNYSQFPNSSGTVAHSNFHEKRSVGIRLRVVACTSWNYLSDGATCE